MNENALILGLRNRDKKIYEYIFNYYYSGLCAYSLKYIQDKEIIEDIVQDFFVTLWTKSDKLEISTSLKSYLFVSVRNRCLNYVKHTRIDDNFKAKIQVLAKGLSNDDFELYVEAELRESFENALNKLPTKCREIFILSRVKGIKNQEIADQLGISKRTVESQISIALRVLRGELKEFLPAYIILFLLR